MRLRLRQLSGLLLFLNACTSQPPVISSAPGAFGRTNGLTFEFGAAVLAHDSTPATYSFQKAKGKRGSAKEGFHDAAEIAVTGPATAIVVPGMIIGGADYYDYFGDPRIFVAFAGAAGAVTAAGAAFIAPATAAKGLIRSWERVSPQQLAECETNLQEALKQAAAQDQFQQFLLAKAAQKSPGRLVTTGPEGKPEQTSEEVDAVFEARIEELRLERAGSDEGSYFLRIKARARLVRMADGLLLHEQPVEYRSGQGLFLDWAAYGSVQLVAETGYRALAEYFVNRLF